MLSSLKTPVSATYPSEIRSPMLASPMAARDDSLKTPITPPAAYLEFLASRSPTVWSAPPSAALHPPAAAQSDVAGHEKQDAKDKPAAAVQKPLASAAEEKPDAAVPDPEAAGTAHEETPERADKPTQLSTPSTTSASSSEPSATTKSVAGSTPGSCDGVKSEAPRPEAPRPESPASLSSFTSSTASNPADAAAKVDSSLSSSPDTTAATKIDSSKSEIRPRRISMPPGSPFSVPGSGRTPRRLGLQIPPSPYSPHVGSPLSATGRCYSPFSATMSPRSAAMSPRERDQAQSYKHVVTRTVTIARQAPIMEPVPASKKRKVEPSAD
jgi:hypothetical protein